MVRTLIDWLPSRAPPCALPGRLPASICPPAPPPPLLLMSVVHFSTMMMHTAWLRLDTSFILVAPVARCRQRPCSGRSGGECPQ
jgi:hypothetical protein